MSYRFWDIQRQKIAWPLNWRYEDREDCDEDQKSPQRVIDKVKEWCDQWLLSLNVTKCYHMSYSSRQSTDTSYYMQQKEYVCIFQKVDYIKDFGVIFDSQLTSSEHIHQKINKA